MTAEEMWLRIPAARLRPSRCEHHPRIRRGRRECRVLQPHPQPCVRSEEAHKQSHHTSTPLTDIPCAMVYGLLRALPGVRDLLVTVMRGSSPAHLAPAQGCQDHTTSPSALASHV